jgi:DNA-binding MarR family transcriptional regulator
MPTEPEGERPAAALGGLFRHLYQSTRQCVDLAFRREGVDLSFAHFVTLYALSVEPGVAGAELARRGSVTAQTMNTILRRLEQDGVIERRPNPKSQRADSWYLTSAGQVRLQRGRVVAESVWAGMFEPFNAQEVAHLRRLLERLLAGLEQQMSERRAIKVVKTSPRPRPRSRKRT